MVLALAIYENQTSTSPVVATSGLSRDFHCPHAGGSRPPRPGRQSPSGAHAPSSPLFRPPTRPTPAALPRPAPPAPGDASGPGLGLLRETGRPRTLAPNGAAAGQFLTPMVPRARQPSSRQEAANSSGGRRAGSAEGGVRGGGGGGGGAGKALGRRGGARGGGGARKARAARARGTRRSGRGARR